VDPVPDPLLFFPGSAADRTRTSGSVAKNSDHYTTEAVSLCILTMIFNHNRTVSLSSQNIFKTVSEVMHLLHVMDGKRGGEGGDGKGRISIASLSSHHRDNHSTIAFGTYPDSHPILSS
jgi:hypothetical protein